MERKFAEEARQFCAAIKALAANEAALENMESYLAHHFDVWMRRYVNSPTGMVGELEAFSRIK